MHALNVPTTWHQALLDFFTTQKKATSEVRCVELRDQVAYVAVQSADGQTTAYICPFQALDPRQHQGVGILIDPQADLQSEQQNPEPCLVTAQFLEQLSPTGSQWQARAAAFVQHQAQASRGEVLSGIYTNASGSVSYNPVAKKEFEKDARRFLTRVSKLLGYPSSRPKYKTGVSFCEGGIAVSGEVHLHLQVSSDTELFIEVSASGFGSPRSPSGASLYWRLNQNGGYGTNRQERWDIRAEDLAQRIRTEAIKLDRFSLNKAS